MAVEEVAPVLKVVSQHSLSHCLFTSSSSLQCFVMLNQLSNPQYGQFAANDASQL